MLKACVAAVNALKTDAAHGVVAARLIIWMRGKAGGFVNRYRRVRSSSPRSHYHDFNKV